MAIGWMSALKIIPWGDVIDAAPGIVKGARKIFRRSEEAAAQAGVTVADAGEDLAPRIAQLDVSLARLAEQQQATAQLMESLAEQNAQVVRAIDVLRVRTRLLMVACAVLAITLAGVVAWALR